MVPGTPRFVICLKFAYILLTICGLHHSFKGTKKYPHWPLTDYRTRPYTTKVPRAGLLCNSQVELPVDWHNWFEN
jgi:hypothetical protein